MSAGAIASIVAGAIEGTNDIVQGWVNYGEQKRMNDYALYSQRETWNREDNAVTRRVADLQRAGLSPTLAAGSAAQSSSPIHIDSPQMNFKQNLSATVQAYRNMITQDKDDFIKDQQAQLLQVQRSLANEQIRNTQAEYQKLLADTEKAKSDNLKSIADTQRSLTMNEGQKIANQKDAHDLEILQKTGILSNSDSPSKSAANITNNVDRIITGVKNLWHNKSSSAEQSAKHDQVDNVYKNLPKAQIKEQQNKYKGGRYR